MSLQQEPTARLDDPLDSTNAANSWWTTANAGEAMPGVPTPLSWSIWGPATELGVRAGFRAMGALAAGEAAIPADPDERLVSVFAGRVATRVEFFHDMGQRLPGTTGAAIAGQLLGHVPDDFTAQPTRRRYPAVATRFPTALLSVHRLTANTSAATAAWWRTEIDRTDLDIDETRAQLRDATDRFTHNVRIQGIATFCGVQPLYDQLTKLITRAPGDYPALMASYGTHAETGVVADLWALSRNALTMAQFLAHHGYHGPAEGEISATVWREDPTPIETLVMQYRTMPDSANPAVNERASAAARERDEQALLADLAPHQRPAAKIVLTLARRYVPLRGIAKVAFLQSLDIARSAARRLGHQLADRGDLGAPEDVFYLTLDELSGQLPLDAKDLVEHRRERRRHHLDHDIPTTWRGQPEPTPIRHDVDTGTVNEGPITGVGVSAGIAEGPVVVVDDPATADIEPGQILVAHTTDPSWAAVMFISSALVVDIGGALSHAAVVARELGIPCVVGAATATQTLRTGDHCRIDGQNGTIHILKRATA